MSSPFPGLAPFTESDEDNARFVGRDDETRLIAANLLAARMTILYGPAGVGKSSVLRAGLIHRLRQEVPGAVRIVVVYVDSWADDPAEAILSAVAAEVGALDETIEPPAADATLDDALEIWADRAHARLLLVLDQFEEYCLYHPPDANAFDRELPLAIERDEVDVRVLISLREDALALLDRYKGRVAGLFDNRLHLDNLSVETARLAITVPIARFNDALPQGTDPVVPEPELADAVLGQIAPGSVALATQGRGTTATAHGRVETAYLQLVMGALWQREVGSGSRSLRIETLRALGGATGIVRAHVDAVAGSLSTKDQAVAARALHFLITPSGTKIAHNARDLSTYAEVDRKRVVDVLDRLCTSESRLLRRLSQLSPADGPRFEVFHDVLAPAILDWRARFLARRQSQRLAPLLALIVALVIALASVALYSSHPGWVRSAEARTVDARRWAGAPVPAAGDYAIVAFDRRSVERLGGKWPVDRRVHARLIDALRRAGARVIGYDIEFREASKDPAADQSLRAAIKRAGPRMVLAAYVFGEDGALSLFGQNAAGETGRMLAALRTRAAYTGIPLTDDGVYRKVEASVRFPEEGAPVVPTYAFAVAQLSGTDVSPWQGAVDIDYGGGPGTLRIYPAADLLDGKVPASDIAGRIIVVGAASGDVHPTPMSDHNMLGAEIQANAVATVRARDQSALRDILLISLLALAPCAFVRARPWVAVSALVGIATAYLVLAQVLWNAGQVVPVALALLALLLSSLGMFAIRWRLRRRTAPLPVAGVRDNESQRAPAAMPPVPTSN